MHPVIYEFDVVKEFFRYEFRSCHWKTALFLEQVIKPRLSVDFPQCTRTWNWLQGKSNDIQTDDEFSTQGVE